MNYSREEQQESEIGKNMPHHITILDNLLSTLQKKITAF